MMPYDVSYGACNTSQQLADIYYHNKNYQDVMDLYDPPCDEMMVNPGVQQQADPSNIGTTITVQCMYQDKTYVEFVNVRDFGLESLWSNAGGFIGMILGYSVLQIPAAIGQIWDSFWKRNKTKA